LALVLACGSLLDAQTVAFVTDTENGPPHSEPVPASEFFLAGPDACAGFHHHGLRGFPDFLPGISGVQATSGHLITDPEFLVGDACGFGLLTFVTLDGGAGGAPQVPLSTDAFFDLSSLVLPATGGGILDPRTPGPARVQFYYFRPDAPPEDADLLDLERNIIFNVNSQAPLGRGITAFADPLPGLRTTSEEQPAQPRRTYEGTVEREPRSEPPREPARVPAEEPANEPPDFSAAMNALSGVADRLSALTDETYNSGVIFGLRLGGHAEYLELAHLYTLLSHIYQEYLVQLTSTPKEQDEFLATAILEELRRSPDYYANLKGSAAVRAFLEKEQYKAAQSDTREGRTGARVLKALITILFTP
jgi:hypothetical protein